MPECSQSSHCSRARNYIVQNFNLVASAYPAEHARRPAVTIMRKRPVPSRHNQLRPRRSRYVRGGQRLNEPNPRAAFSRLRELAGQGQTSPPRPGSPQWHAWIVAIEAALHNFFGEDSAYLAAVRAAAHGSDEDGSGDDRQRRLLSLERVERIVAVVTEAAMEIRREHKADPSRPSLPDPAEAEPVGESQHQPESQTARGADRAVSDPRSVFLVRGRNDAAASAVTQLLISADLRVVDWERAVREAGGGTQHLLDIVRAGMGLARATVVLFTPDDWGFLDPRLEHGTADNISDRALTGRPRQNVILEAGMALALRPAKTVLVGVGTVEGMSDLAGLHVVYLDDSTQRRQALLQRLRDMGCAVDMDNDLWHSAGDFQSAVLPLTVWHLTDEAIATPEQKRQAHAATVSPALVNFYPSDQPAPSGRTVDLHLRCAVALPAADSAPRSDDPPVSLLRAEGREALLVEVLEESELTAWVHRQSSAFKLGDLGRWRPTGRSAGDFSQLYLQPMDESGSPGPMELLINVHTGHLASSQAHVTPSGLTAVADVMLRLLEYDSERRPAEIRHATTPPPAPAALSLSELLDAVVAVLGACDIARAAFQPLLGSAAPGEFDIACWLRATGSQIDRVIDLAQFEVLPGNVTSGDGFIARRLAPAHGQPLTPDERREIAKEMIDRLLERSGRRGYSRYLQSL